MARLRTDLHRGVFNRLNEALFSEVGAVANTTSNVATQVSTATIDLFLDLGASELCRTVYLVPGRATFTAAIGQREIPYQSMTGTMDLSNGTVDTSYPWVLDQVSYNGTALQRVSRLALDRNSLAAYQSVATGTPTYFYRDGQSHIGLYVAPSFTATLTGYGYMIPPSITAQTAVTWASDDMASLLELYAAVKIAEKQYNDASLYGRIPHLVGQYNSTRESQYAKLSPATRMSLGLVPPIPYAQWASQGQTPQESV